MRVHIYKRDEGQLTVMVEPTHGKGLPPVLLENVTAENVAEVVGPVIAAARAPGRQDPR